MAEYDRSNAQFAGIYDGTKAIGTVPDDRRSCLGVQLWCEGNHRCELCLQQHKDNTFGCVPAKEGRGLSRGAALCAIHTSV
jgi:hypothetical protein